jgi:hypothetical protein
MADFRILGPKLVQLLPQKPRIHQAARFQGQVHHDPVWFDSFDEDLEAVGEATIQAQSVQGGERVLAGLSRARKAAASVAAHV